MRSACFLALLLLVPFPGAHALDRVRYDPSLPKDAICEVKIADLRPTQFCLGMVEVRLRAAKVRDMTPHKLDAYLDDHLATIVIGPGGAPFIVDRHHLARLMIEAKAGPAIRARVLENDSKLTEQDFWAHMQDKQWVYLYDEHGKGPFQPSDLPRTIADMRDDPYRSLAWLVRERGAIHNVETPFAEFQWANYFRSRVPIQPADSDLDQAAATAVPLAHLPAASGLPGFIPAAPTPAPAAAPPVQRKPSPSPSQSAGGCAESPGIRFSSRIFADRFPSLS
jgi:hypothetical protein